MIEFRSVTKRYAGGTLAVSDFDMVAASHRTTVLVGSSGSGKTTILRMINRMVEPTSGTVLIDGQDVAGMDPVRLRRSIGYVMQNSGLLPHRTVLQNIATVPRLNGVSRSEAARRARGLMQTVGLDESLAGRYPAQLSGGQQQRVGVARGLASDPNILLMDEPFGAVDPLVRTELQQELLRLQSQLGKTVVFVTHDIDEALLLGEQLIIFRVGGRVAQRGTPAEILAHPADEFVSDFVGVTRGKRSLTLAPDGRVLLDAAGRPAGVFAGHGDGRVP
ncbi:MAG TPA: ATP-binding cassette domain-containing protein [Microbacteriaceae bacterium]|nr:ATP-binding cassette domain-containing protein [Microbacteriaceae bacterium]